MYVTLTINEMALYAVNFVITPRFHIFTDPPSTGSIEGMPDYNRIRSGMFWLRV